ncbi:Sensor protein of zinc sigma-54-dependent two-component system [Minicystis rosea]|nr:Sensor protein of zinc sigma-54-dependent two-component system [Minicystis rosea]
MSTPPKHHRILFFSAFVICALAMVPVRSAVSWYEHPFAGILLDPDGVVSTFGIPSWDGFRQKLGYPDQIVDVDGRPLAPSGGRALRALAWDEAIAAAARADRPSVHVRVRKPDDRIEAHDLAITKLDPSAFWMIGVVPIGIALLYVAGALVALLSSPRGRLARTFAKTTLFAALFLFTLFDYHTTRQLVPLFHLAFAMVPMGFFVLALRLPDDVPFLERHPWIPAALDAVGLLLGFGMIAAQLTGGTTMALRSVCSTLFGASFTFFVVTFLVRFARARGDRRATLRALLVAMVPAHAVIGTAFVFSVLELGGGTSMLLVVPALALTPLSSVFALIRHDLWGSRALLSRVLIRVVIIGLVCAGAVGLGTGLAAAFHVPWTSALLAASGAGLFAGVFVAPALRFGDHALFPARAVYKPTIEQLSEDLTIINVPEEVAHAVERTVRRWLPCEKVEFLPVGPRPDLGSDDAETVSGIRVRASDGSPARAADREYAPADHLTIDVLFRGSPLAVLRVGKKRGGALFTSEDVDLLRTIANQAALALAHAYTYQELELRRKQQAAAWRGEREALVETVAAEIAHEIRYPINYFRSLFVRGQGELRVDAEDVDIGCDEVERLERLVAGLRRVAPRLLSRSTVGVGELLVKVERLLRDQLDARRLEVDFPPEAAIRCDVDQATQVLVNLVSNALDAAGPGGRVGVTFTAGHEKGELVVWDDGPGFTGDPARIFAPWYTTKPRGTGLGLSITQRIVRAHGWKIDPDRRDGRTRFVIEVPHTDLVDLGGSDMEVA